MSLLDLTGIDANTARQMGTGLADGVAASTLVPDIEHAMARGLEKGIEPTRQAVLILGGGLIAVSVGFLLYAASCRKKRT